MKRFIAIVCCVLLVFSTCLPGTALGDAAAGCQGCGCAAATCCSAADDSGDPSPAMPATNEVGGGPKLLASVGLPARCSAQPAVLRSWPPRNLAERADVSVPVFLRHGRFLI